MGIVVDFDSLATARVPGAASFPAELLRALQSKHAQEREGALECLCFMATMAQTSAWLEGKSDGTRRSRQAVGRLAPSYERALEGCLKDPSVKIRFIAGATLLVLEPNNAEALNAVVAGLRIMDPELIKVIGPLRLTHEGIIACLVDALGNKEGKVRRAAAVALMEIGPPAKAAVPALVEFLKSKEAIDDRFDPWPHFSIFCMRANLAAKALQVMGPSAAPAVPTLIEMLKTSEAEERGDVLICLARIGPAAQKAVLPIRQLLKIEAQPHAPKPLPMPHRLNIPLGAACALLRIVPGDEQALSIIKAGLRASDKNLRLLALEACAETKVKEKALVANFVSALKDEHLREAAANALAEVGPDAKEAIPDLTEILINDRSENPEVARALEKIGKAALPALVKVAKHQGAGSRFSAMLALGNLEGQAKRTVPVLINLLADEDFRLAAVVALGKLGSQARQALLPLLVVYLRDLLGTDGEPLVLERWALRQVSN
jgi:HEAT repeat protein